LAPRRRFNGGPVDVPTLSAKERFYTHEYDEAANNSAYKKDPVIYDMERVITQVLQAQDPATPLLYGTDPV
jgi:hypothetical protein